jgi:hypothetical protein
MWLRRAVKPECISAVTERATARAVASWGHSFAWGKSSARYSQMASESQMSSSPCTSAGTLPLGESFAMFATVSGWPSCTTTSRKGCPVWASAR